MCPEVSFLSRRENLRIKDGGHFEDTTVLARIDSMVLRRVPSRPSL